VRVKEGGGAEDEEARRRRVYEEEVRLDEERRTAGAKRQQKQSVAYSHINNLPLIDSLPGLRFAHRSGLRWKIGTARPCST